MNELATYQSGLPDTIDDLAHFLLIAPEKATAMRAEIRAIQKVGLAKAVYDQKLEEQRRLCDMILDASVRLGEMTMAIPKADADRRSEKYQNDGAVGLVKTKTETVRDLGFSSKQVERFETLADNRDLVELEKAQAREEGRMPTRTNVINMAQARKKLYDRDMAQIDEDSKIHKKFLDAIYAPLLLPEPSADVVSATIRATEGKWMSDFETLGMAIQKLKEIQILMRKEAYKHGKK